MSTAITKLENDSDIIEVATRIAYEEGLDWDGDVKYVFVVLLNDRSRIVKIGNNNDTAEAVIRKWMRMYKKGIDNRPSRRISNTPGTISDPIISAMIADRLPHLSVDRIADIIAAHRLSMSAENILGLLLEEYLAVRLRGYGWHCAWGSTLKAIDFVHENGNLLQVKNRSNSENSSSKEIRKGTVITKWFRVKSHRVQYMWAELNHACGTNHLSEEDFVGFVRDIIRRNPGCFAIEPNNPWINA